MSFFIRDFSGLGYKGISYHFKETETKLFKISELKDSSLFKVYCGYLAVFIFIGVIASCVYYVY